MLRKRKSNSTAGTESTQNVGETKKKPRGRPRKKGTSILIQFVLEFTR